jgi:hypothetical protein
VPEAIQVNQLTTKTLHKPRREWPLPNILGAIFLLQRRSHRYKEYLTVEKALKEMAWPTQLHKSNNQKCFPKANSGRGKNVPAEIKQGQNIYLLPAI